MFKCLALLFLLTSATAQAATPALEALETYAFPPRDDATRQGIRTDALLVLRDGQILSNATPGQPPSTRRT
jgi:hypothetical protein